MNPEGGCNEPVSEILVRIWGPTLVTEYGVELVLLILGWSCESAIVLTIERYELLESIG